MKSWIAALLIFALPNAQVAACCMVPVTYEGTISQSAHEAVIIHARGREELVLRINYQITGKTLPENFAWIITVPNEPDEYAIADPEIFEDMFNLSKKLLQKPEKKRKFKGGFGGGGFGGALGADVELGKHVQVGPYDIQPVRGVGENAITGLNKWLKEKGFPTEAPDHMKYFIENDFTFLCVKVVPPKGEDNLKSSGLLPPLHLSFESELPFYPMRFSSRQGVFTANLHVLTQRSFNYRKSNRVLKQMDWNHSEYKRNAKLVKEKMPASLQEIIAKSKHKKIDDPWFYNNIRADEVNKKKPIAKWKSDVFFNGLPTKKKRRAEATPSE